LARTPITNKAGANDCAKLVARKRPAASLSTLGNEDIVGKPNFSFTTRASQYAKKPLRQGSGPRRASDPSLFQAIQQNPSVPNRAIPKETLAAIKFIKHDRLYVELQKMLLPRTSQELSTGSP
jgi:hypothetical protein